MKYLFTLTLWCFSFCFVHSQCNSVSINVNNFTIEKTGDNGTTCTYQINVTAQSNNGNPSVRPFSRCGNGSLTEITNVCWTFPNKGVFYDFTASFTCGCGVDVNVQLVTFSSSNCGGNECASVGTSVILAIDLTNFKILESARDQVCFKWEIDPSENNFFQLEKSMDGKSFVPMVAMAEADYVIQGTSATYCMDRPGAGVYFRLKATNNEGHSRYSPIRFLNAKYSGMDIRYHPVQRFIHLIGVAIELKPTFLSVINSCGQMVYRENVKSDGMILPDLPKGIYFVRVEQDRESFVKKIVY